MGKSKKPKIKATFDVTGYSISDLMKMDISEIAQLNKSNISRITSRLVSAMNKRLKRLEKSEIGQLSQTYYWYKKKGSKGYSVKGLSKKSTISLFETLKERLSKEQSTISGFKKYREQMYEKLGIKSFGKDIQTERKFWELYNKYAETQSTKEAENWKKGGGSPVIMQYIRNNLKDFESMTIEERKQKIDSLYEEMQLQEQSQMGMSESDFFDDEENDFFEM